MNIGRVLRIGGAIALLVAGLVHLDLYFGGYRSAGSVPSFGRSILLNAIVSGIVAVAVAARREWFVRLAGIIVPVATLAAFSYTHSEHTFLGFQGEGLDPSPQAQLVLISEIAAIVLLAATFIPSIAERDESSGPAFLAAAGAVAAVALIGFGAYWARRIRHDLGRELTVVGGHRRLRVRTAGAHRPGRARRSRGRTTTRWATASSPATDRSRATRSTAGRRSSSRSTLPASTPTSAGSIPRCRAR